MMRFEGIQCLRAIAALLVMWAHLKFVGDFSEVPWIQTAAGGVGVDIFFVISGFVIPFSAAKLKFDYKSFAVNRFTRVVPYYYLLTIPLIVISIYKGYDSNFNTLWNSFFFLPIFDFGRFENPYHPYGWTLCFELWFYVVFGILLALLKEKAIPALPIVFVIATIAIFITYNGDWKLPSVLFNPITLEFAAGVILYKFISNLRYAALALFLICAPLLFYFVIKTGYLGYHIEMLSDKSLGLRRAMIWGSASACLVGAFLAMDNVRAVSWPNWLIALGDASFSLYLIQPYALTFTKKLSPILGLPGPVSGLFFVFSTVSLGVLFHYFVEKKLILFTRSIIDQRSIVNSTLPSSKARSPLIRRGQRLGRPEVPSDSFKREEGGLTAAGNTRDD
jgi:exopolysaccharide production protein ExoZ